MAKRKPKKTSRPKKTVTPPVESVPEETLNENPTVNEQSAAAPPEPEEAEPKKTKSGFRYQLISLIKKPPVESSVDQAEAAPSPTEPAEQTEPADQSRPDARLRRDRGPDQGVGKSAKKDKKDRREEPLAPPPPPRSLASDVTPPRSLASDVAPPTNGHLTKQELEDDLQAIYEEDANSPDMTRLDKQRPSFARRLLIGLVVFFGFLAVVSWAGFFLFSPADRGFSGEGVEVSIDGPHEMKSGEPVTYIVRYRNGERVPLGTASLEMRLPPEFTLLESDPPAEEGVWRLGSLAPGKKGKVTLEGVVQAPLEKQLDIQAILTYRPADFNSEFQKVSTLSAPVADSVFEMAATGPAKIMPGDKVTIDVGYVNLSEADQPFANLQLRAVFPESFIPETAEPTANDENQTTWNLADVAPNTEGHVKVTGGFASDAKGRNEIKFQLGYLDENEDFQLQKEALYAVDVVEGQLALALILNGKTGDQAVNFGDTLHYAVTWRNTGGAALDDVEMSVFFETQPDPDKILDWNNLEDKEEGVRDQNHITWTQKQVSVLKRIGPEDEGTIDFDIPLLAAPLADATSDDYRVTAWLEAKIGLIDREPADRTVKAPPFAAILSSDTALVSDVRYFNDDGLPVGTGPLPPKVGEATTYRVNWTVTNSLHDLADLKISARLPDNVMWTGQSSLDAGDINFDAAAGKLIWTLNWLPNTVDRLELSYDVSITPTEDQRDRVPTLIDAVIFEARDKVNSNPIILSAPPSTTSPDNDELAAGKGRVQ